MFIVKNIGNFSLLIRDLNLHISGGKEIDLDTIIKRENTDKSFNLQKMIDSGKIAVIQKDNFVSEKTNNGINTQIQKIQQIPNNNILLELKSDILSIKQLLQNGIPNSSVREKIEEIDPEIRNRLVNLKVHNLSKDDNSVEKNYETLGDSTEKKESLNDLLNTLDLLEKGDMNG